MANISDAYGTFEVEKVGQEFLDFVKVAQGKNAYYLLIDEEDLNLAKVDDDGNLRLSFSTGGRWSYSTNLEGYLDGKWLQSEEDQKTAYANLIEAIEKKNGSITVEYQDSDTAMDWMGSGLATLRAVDGTVQFIDNFESEEITISKFAQAQGESEYWALEYIYGDEVADQYGQYYDNWKKDHEFKKGESEPAGPSEWYDNEYQMED